MGCSAYTVQKLIPPVNRPVHQAGLEGFRDLPGCILQALLLAWHPTGLVKESMAQAVLGSHCSEGPPSGAGAPYCLLPKQWDCWQATFYKDLFASGFERTQFTQFPQTICLMLSLY